MAEPWSTSMPSKLLAINSSGQFGDNTIRSQADVGPAKMRRRSTSTPDICHGYQNLTSAQYDTLETFYKTTLGYGALPFTWTHPVSGDSVDMRFMAPPQYVVIGGDLIRVEYKLEILP